MRVVTESEEQWLEERRKRVSATELAELHRCKTAAVVHRSNHRARTHSRWGIRMKVNARLIAPRAGLITAVTIPKARMSQADQLKKFLDTSVLPDGFTCEIVPDRAGEQIKRVLIHDAANPGRRPMRIPAGRVLLSIPDQGIVSFSSTHLVRELFLTAEIHRLEVGE